MMEKRRSTCQRFFILLPRVFSPSALIVVTRCWLHLINFIQAMKTALTHGELFTTDLTSFNHDLFAKGKMEATWLVRVIQVFMKLTGTRLFEIFQRSWM